MAEQPGRTGKCTNFGNCTLADTGAEIPIAEGSAPVCTECGRSLMVSQPPPDRSRVIGAVIALVVLVAVLALGAKFLLDFLKTTGVPAQPTVSQTPPAPPPATDPVAPPPEPVAPPPAQAEPAEPPRPATPPETADMVRVADFWIDRTEVSIGDFRVAFPGYKAPRGFSDDLPVVDVTWEDAQRYAERNGKRLCLESEWLFALSDELKYPAMAALGGGTMDRPRAVTDERDQNSLGLLNMIGNVSEWVDPGTHEAAFVGGYWYWNSEGRPASDIRRVNRLATRQGRQHYIGFRTCRDAGPGPH